MAHRDGKAPARALVVDSSLAGWKNRPRPGKLQVRSPARVISVCLERWEERLEDRHVHLAGPARRRSASARSRGGADRLDGRDAVPAAQGEGLGRAWSTARSARRSGSASTTDATGTFFTSNIHGTPEWDRADGFSFWVKGDGADGFGGLEFIYDDDYAVRYDLCFPVKGTEWTKIDRRLARPRPRPPRAEGRSRWGRPAATRRRSSSALWVGKWWYWGDYPAMTLRRSTRSAWSRRSTATTKDYRPDGPPLARTLAEAEGRASRSRS